MTTYGDDVTIRILVVGTPSIREENANISSLARHIVADVNRTYSENDLPIMIELADNSLASYTEADSIDDDLENLIGATTPSLRRVHTLAETHEADLVIMLIKDTFRNDTSNGNSYPDPIKHNIAAQCAKSGELLAKGTGRAFAVMSHPCVMTDYAAVAIGTLQGAALHDMSNPEFSYGRGYRAADSSLPSTIMVSGDTDCDSDTTDIQLCDRERIWSDPHRFFFGTLDPAGTVENWNARVLFATAPHIASLRGEAQTYDSVMPTGAITLPSSIPTRGTLPINATFSEDIHEWFPPIITVTDGATTTAVVMTRTSPTTYTYPHLLDGEQGKVQLLFSNARDIFGNPVVKTPTSGGSFTANAADATVHPPPISGSVTRVSEDFETRLSHSLWRLLGDGTWLRVVPTEKIPDADMATNRVLASDECDDSCILLLNSPLNTVEPLTISFDRYVGGKIDRDEGLHVEYTTDRETWNTLASYTENNGHDTGRWERSTISLTIPENWAKLRFHAMSSTQDEPVEIDNIVISPTEAAVPDITFSSSLSSGRTNIILTLSKSTSHMFSASDFEISHGRVSSIQNIQNSPARVLTLNQTIPYDTPVTVTYVGDSLDPDMDGAILHSGTSSVAAPVPAPDMPPTISAIPDVEVVQGETATRQVTASDPDGDDIVLSVSEGPDFVTIADGGSGGSGTITISPTSSSHVGAYTVT